jgi:D-glycero-alpha-D-manno-heptose-7-phosphate kinase
MPSNSHAPSPRRIINAVAPIRVCDCGGWTDTWFARRGLVFNVAVYPYVEVQVEVAPAAQGEGRVVIHAENYGERYVPSRREPPWGPHPLLEAAIAHMGVPDDLALEVTIYSEAPGGASTGTSAAVTVALVGALDRLTTGRLTPHEVAYAAHAVEVERLGQQSGVQDQLCAAFGGISFIEIFEYPRATVSPVPVSQATWWELERRLLLVYLGRSHHSSDVHRAVIAGLEGGGDARQPLDGLRAAAAAARDAVASGDFDALGRAMTANTEAQAALHPALVSGEAHRLIALAREYGCLGWKVNGAGGEGGSLTLLAGASAPERRALVRAIAESGSGWRVIPTYLARQGLRVWECQSW